jgi:hypothetical protein
MYHTEMCASAFSQKAVMNQFGFLAPTISEIGQERNSGAKKGRHYDGPEL